MKHSNLALFKEGSITAEGLKDLIAAEYSQFSALEEFDKLKARLARWKKVKSLARNLPIDSMPQEINDLAKELSIDSMPYNCVWSEANNIVRLLGEYPDLVNDFLLMKIRRMRELYLNPANDIEREYALANARFIKAVVEKNPAAMKICALRQHIIEIFSAPRPTVLYGRILKFKIAENLLTANDFQYHLEAIKRVAYRHGLVEPRRLTKEERASGLYHGCRKYIYLSDEEFKNALQKRIGQSVKSKKGRKPLNYELNTS